MIINKCCLTLSYMRIHILLIIACSLLEISCVREREEILPHTYEIFPNQQGSSRIMFVADTTFNTAGINDPVVDRYFRQEVLGDTSVDLTGRLLTRVETYRSPLSLGENYDFQFDRLWAQYLSPSDETYYFAERIVENTRTLVLRFPVFPGISWDGNQFNTVDEQIFTYQNVDTTVTVRGNTFVNCVMVLRELRQNFISDIYSYEIYAPNIGLIKKYDRRLIFDKPGVNGTTEFNPASSSVYYEEIVSWQ